MTELKKCITDNKFYCHSSNDEYYMKKNKKRRRLKNKYKHIISNKQFPKKRMYNNKKYVDIKWNLLKNSDIENKSIDNTIISKKPTYKDVLLSDYINNAINIYKNTWDIIDNTDIIKKEIKAQTKSSSFFNFFGLF